MEPSWCRHPAAMNGPIAAPSSWHSFPFEGACDLYWSMRPTVDLLGRPEITTDVTVRPTTSKSVAALYYLAYQPGWVGRDELLYLFWPDAHEQRARGNLRQLLTTMRRLPYAAGLGFEAERLRWEVDSDVSRFREALFSHDHVLAVKVYRGPLLHGFHLAGAPEFVSWLELERSELHDSWRRSLLIHSASLVEQGGASEASELLERLLESDPFDEIALRQLLPNLEPDEASRRFKRYRATLERELGSQPEPETLSLVDKIGSAARASTTTAVRPVTRARAPVKSAKRSLGLPRPLIPFVGRAGDLELLGRNLENAACRLLTILGAGGMGKTRLAIELAARAAERLRDGACFVPLASVVSSQGVGPAIATALGVSLAQGESPVEQISSYLEDKEMVLVLDNLEHHPGVGNTILHLLEHGSGLQILATSRERLNLQAEWVHELAGLHFPDGDVTEDLEQFDAVRLLLQAAKRADGGFTLTPLNAPAIVRVCRLTGGMPLALELAASWLRVMPVQDVAGKLESGLELLQVSEAYVEVRHHSVRAAFDHSWRLLTAGERQSLCRLAVFQGGFTRDAALEVARASLPMLLALRNKSFLMLEPTGRFGLHPLISQYLRERASESPARQEQEGRAHAEYFCALLDRLKRFSGVKGQRHAFEQIEAEYQNIAAAWRWAAHHLREDLLDRLPHMLVPFLLSRFRDHELQELLDEALSRVPEGSRVWAHLKSVEARRLMVNARRFHQAHEQLCRSLEVYLGLADRERVANGMRWLGVATYHLGQVEEALRLWHDAVDIYRSLGDEKAVADILGDAAILTTDITKEQQLYEEALAYGRRIGDLDIVVHVLNNYALAVARSYGEFNWSREMIDEAVELERRELDKPSKLAERLLTSSRICLDSGDLVTAAVHARESHEIVREFSYSDASELRSEALALLAWARYLDGDIPGARELITSLAPEAREITSLLVRARLALVAGEVGNARKYLGRCVERIPDIVGERDKLHWRVRAKLLLAEAWKDETATAVGHLREAIDAICDYTLVPMALEAFVVAEPYLPEEKSRELLSLVAAHLAANFETRKRALERIGPAERSPHAPVVGTEGILALAAQVSRLIA